MNNLISCRPESFGPYQDRAFAALAELGIHHVEVTAPPPEGVAALSKTLRSHGLQAASVAFYRSHHEADFLERMSDAAQAACALGAPLVFTSQSSKEQTLPAVYDRLRAAGNIACDHGVTLVLETHPDLCGNAAEILATMAGINHPHVRLNFDPANILYYNHDLDPVDQLRKVAHYAASVHLKESRGGYHAWDFPAIGEGLVRWKELFSLMNARGMHGPFTLEMEGTEGEKLTYEETVGRIARSLDYLRSIDVCSTRVATIS